MSPTSGTDFSPIVHARDDLQKDPDNFLSYRRRIRSTKDSPLEYDPSRKSLVIWKWPVDERGQRVPPSELHDHRATHAFQFPRCMCSGLDDPRKIPETSIFLWDSDRDGKSNDRLWVAACANQNYCGYFLILEWFYMRENLPDKYYPLRNTKYSSPAESAHANTTVFAQRHENAVEGDATMKKRTRKRKSKSVSRSIEHQSDIHIRNDSSSELGPQKKRARIGIRDLKQDGPFDVPNHPGPSHNDAEPFENLLKLDTSAGIASETFKRLFVACDCRHVMTVTAFRNHRCDIIELSD